MPWDPGTSMGPVGCDPFTVLRVRPGLDVAVGAMRSVLVQLKVNVDKIF